MINEAVTATNIILIVGMFTFLGVIAFVILEDMEFL